MPCVFHSVFFWIPNFTMKEFPLEHTVKCEETPQIKMCSHRPWNDPPFAWQSSPLASAQREREKPLMIQPRFDLLGADCCFQDHGEGGRSRSVDHSVHNPRRCLSAPQYALNTPGHYKTPIQTSIRADPDYY